MLAAFLERLLKDKPDQDRFARRFIAAVRASGLDEPLRYDAGLFRLLRDDGSFLNLHNAHAAYLKAPRAQQKAVLDQFVGMVSRPGKQVVSADEARGMLLPILRNLSQLEEVRIYHAERDGWDTVPEFRYRRIGQECAELLALDHPEHTATLTQGPEKDWNLDLDEAFSIARDNLRSLPLVPFHPLAPGLFQAAWGDAYDSSRALLPELLHRLPLRGVPVFMVPTRDTLLVAGDRDPEAITAMLEHAKRRLEDGRIISWEVFSHEAQQVVPYPLIDAGHRRQQGELRLLVEHDVHASQKQLLDRLHEVQGEDIFVASFLVDSEQGVSVCAWTRDVASSLPRTGRIAFVMPDGPDRADTLFVDWDLAMSVIGHLLKPDPRHIHPPRFLTSGFPDEDQLAQLRTLA